MRREVILCFGLAAITIAVFWPLGGHDFINYDDPDYVTENPAVQAGLTPSTVSWAFEAEHAKNWHPLTWLSHALDCQLFGLKPGAHHLVNLGFHVASVLLLFLTLDRMTRAAWRSAFVAALFALHPLHVESVAWVAERKDVLSAFFFMLTLWAYVRYAEASTLKPAAHSRDSAPPLHTPHSRAVLWYLLALLFFSLGLMSKPMVVTLPLVLVLLDYWPLKRIAECGVRSAEYGASVRKLLVEKLPFLALAVGAGLLTLRAQNAGGAVRTFEQLPLASRLANAAWAYVAYLGKAFWPADLAVFYPHVPVPAWRLVFSVLLLLGVTALCLAMRRSRPCLLMGWCWYCGMLVPVIGLVQVGWQASADRYTYLPLIGVFVMIAWGAGRLRPQSAAGKLGPALAAALLLAVCATMTRLQLAPWQDSLKLFQHALAVNPENWLAHNNLGTVLAEQGKLDEAGDHFRTALQIKPTYDDARSNYGRYLAEHGRLDAARSELEALLRTNPKHARAQRNLGYVLLSQGQISEGIAHYALARQLQPTDAATAGDLMSALGKQKQSAAAQPYVREALGLLPTGEMQAQLASTWAGQGKFLYAVEGYRAALARQPQTPELLNNLAWLLATCPDATARNGTEAVQLAEQACALTRYQRPMLVGTLAAAYAEAGRFSEAVATAEKAAALASAGGDEALAQENRRLLQQYRAGKPHHEQPANPGSGFFPVE